MRTLGIGGVFHDATVVLVEDGQVVFAVEEERLSRVKNALVFPKLSLAHVLDRHGLNLADIDAIGFYWDPKLDLGWAGSLLKEALRRPGAVASLLATKHGGELYLRQAFLMQLKLFAAERGEALPPIRFFDHPSCHAVSAFVTSPFERTAVLVSDGMGGRSCTTFFRAEPGTLERLASIDLPDSLGMAYGGITQHLGFKHTSDEWKVMGLAPYGERDPQLDAFFQELVPLLPGGRYCVERRFTLWHKNPFSFGRLLSPAVEKHLGPPRGPDEPLTDRHRAIARALQVRTEEAIYHLMRELHRRTGLRDLCFGGGVALNCVANGGVLANTPFERVHVPYAPGDAGAALGAAILAAGGPVVGALSQSPYLGPSFSEREAQSDLERSRLPFERLEDPYVETARLLAAGEIVGWFQGRMELGPRALGNRSILADPRRAEMKEQINAAVKYREGFRPFAPAVLAERAADYFEAPVPSPYMSFALRVRGDRIPAVTHVDGTGRLQTVEAERNPAFHRLLRAFEDETGVPVLLNTSFNVKGEPIVCSPLDAVRCFFSTGLDHLVMGPFLVSKRARERPRLALAPVAAEA